MNQTPAGRSSRNNQEASLRLKRVDKVQKKNNELLIKLTSKKEDRAFKLDTKSELTPQLLSSKGNQESTGDFLEVHIPGDTI